MNKTAITIMLKLVMIFVLAAITFLAVPRNSLAGAVVTGIFGTAVIYLGDIYVRPQVGNIIMAVGDGAVALIIAYIASLVVPGFFIGTYTLAAFGILVAVEEYFFHLFLRRRERIIT